MSNKELLKTPSETSFLAIRAQTSELFFNFYRFSAIVKNLAYLICWTMIWVMILDQDSGLQTTQHRIEYTFASLF